jgi:hypothetical protein
MDDQPLEPLDIDDRTGGERLLAGGRAGVDRLGALLDTQPLDLAALIWMLCTSAWVGTQIYNGLQLSFGNGGGAFWNKLAVLARTGGPSIAITCLIGIVLAALVLDATAGRIALWLATIGGLWVGIAGLMQIAVVLHTKNNDVTLGISFDRGNRAVEVLQGLAFAGFGLVVAAVGYGLARMARSEPTDIS